MKIWECSIDLVKYLSETVADLHGKKVLELGYSSSHVFTNFESTNLQKYFYEIIYQNRQKMEIYNRLFEQKTL